MMLVNGSHVLVIKCWQQPDHENLKLKEIRDSTKQRCRLSDIIYWFLE